MRSGNPTLREEVFRCHDTIVGERMTLSGAVNRTLLMFLLVAVSAGYVYWQMSGVIGLSGNGKSLAVTDPSRFGALMIYAIVGLVVSTVVGFATVFTPEWSPGTAPIYALAEGLCIGVISAVAEAKFPGIVPQAVGLTFGVFFSLLLAYKSGLIQATENFKLMVVSATGAIAVLYLVDLMLMHFGIRVPMIHESGIVGVLFSLFVVAVAAFNLVLDFDFIEAGVEAGAPRYMEWYGAFSLTVTLIWLYLEILRLLMKARSRD
ncbi:Bax inhibitor-1/YccA family protein [Azospirillum soli]|uniref:Bax inhibitor-1/YccA family protein n=1 Tax=Azospirillum soli TaxID=1304799 RepID=UPI001AEB71CB|nr:Bax inhibitor-1/YccA family protein [Azospirillum soli]MBP2312628.1 putative YccA/Bax inhibitor family protein [Azospirillum soli]